MKIRNNINGLYNPYKRPLKKTNGNSKKKIKNVDTVELSSSKSNLNINKLNSELKDRKIEFINGKYNVIDTKSEYVIKNFKKFDVDKLVDEMINYLYLGGENEQK